MRKFLTHFLIISTVLDVCLSYFFFEMHRGDSNSQQASYLESNPVMASLIESVGLEVALFAILPAYFALAFSTINIFWNQVRDSLRPYFAYALIVPKSFTLFIWALYITLYFGSF